MSRETAVGAASTLATLLVATPTLAQSLAQGAEPHVSWWRVILALLLCLGLAVAGALALKYRLHGSVFSGGKPGRGFNLLASLRTRTFAFTSPPRRLQLVELVRVNPQVTVCLLTWDGKEYLVAALPASGFKPMGQSLSSRPGFVRRTVGGWSLSASIV